MRKNHTCFNVQIQSWAFSSAFKVGLLAQPYGDGDGDDDDDDVDGSYEEAMRMR